MLPSSRLCMDPQENHQFKWWMTHSFQPSFLSSAWVWLCFWGCFLVFVFHLREGKIRYLFWMKNTILCVTVKDLQRVYTNLPPQKLSLMCLHLHLKCRHRPSNLILRSWVLASLRQGIAWLSGQQYPLKNLSVYSLVISKLNIIALSLSAHFRAIK